VSEYAAVMSTDSSQQLMLIAGCHDNSSVSWCSWCPCRRWVGCSWMTTMMTTTMLMTEVRC